MSALAAIALAQAFMPTACAALCDADRLRPVFAKLRAARAEGRTVRIVQIGDSHTAADQVTGSWRALLQAKFGAGGRGVLAPGRPYQGYLTRGVTAGQTGSWQVDGIFGAAWHGGVPVGLSGYTLTGGEGAALTLRADAATFWFDRVTLCGLARPGAGTVTLAAGATAEPIAAQIDFGLEAEAPLCRTVDLPQQADALTLTVAGGPVSLTSWSTESGKGGVVLSNLGTVGAQFVHWTTRTSDRLTAAEFAAYRPDLIVVAFGTNEAFVPRFSAPDYQAQLRAAIERLKRLAPGVPILLMNAPDSATRQPALQAGAAPCPATTPFAPATRDYPAPALEPTFPVQPGATPAGAGSWGPTAALPVVQAITARVAHDAGVAAWNWSARMGGRCTATLWAQMALPLMRGDRVHFTTPGAAEIARRLEADWEAAMDAHDGR